MKLLPRLFLFPSHVTLCDVPTSKSSAPVTAPSYSPVMELVTHHVKPHLFGQYKALLAKTAPLTSRYLLRHGAWITTLGGSTNEATQLVNFESFMHRTAVVAAMEDDEEVVKEYSTPLLALLESAHTETLVHPTWAPLINNAVTAAEGRSDVVFEHSTFRMLPGGPSTWGGHMEKYIEVVMEHWDLFGVFFTELGATDQVHVIWRHASQDERRSTRTQMKDDALFVTRYIKLQSLVYQQSHKLIAPAPWSPAQ